MIEDSSLALPPRPHAEPALAFPPGILVSHLDPATPIELTGPNIVARGRASHGIGAVTVFGTAAIRDLRVREATTQSVELSPLGIQRTIAIAGHQLIERVHLLDDRTCMIVEWVRLSADDRTDGVPHASREPAEPEIFVEWWTGPHDDNGVAAPSNRSPATRSGSRWYADETRLRVDFTNAATTVCIAAPPAAARLTAVPAPAGEGLHCSLSAPVPAGLPLRLILAAWAGDDAQAILSPPPDVAGRIRARSAILRRRQREHVRLVSPEPDADQAVEWAKQRIDWIVDADPRHGLAALAAGEFRLSGDLIATLATGQTSHGAIPLRRPESDVLPGSSPGPDATADWLLLVARHLAWTGELALAQAVWPRVRFAVASLAGAGLAPPPDWFADLLMAAESVGDTDTTRAIQALRSSGDASPSEASSLRFPASRIVASTTDAGIAAAPLAALVHGLLGAAPDAVRGRLRLRPAAPPSWDRYEISCLRMGEASIDIRYVRNHSRHEFRLDQPAGATPIRIVFEPLIPGRALMASTVDDQPASLVARPHPEGMIVPVQIVLDHERSIVLETVD